MIDRKISDYFAPTIRGVKRCLSSSQTESEKRRRHKNSESPPRADHSALLPEEEVVDDWLIDDLVPSSSRGVKRRRSHHYEGEPQRKPNRLSSPSEVPRQLDNERRNSYRPVSPVDLFDSSNSGDTREQELEEVEQSDDVTEIISSNVGNISQESMEMRQQQSNPRPATSNSHHSPLSMFGVVRMQMPPPFDPTVSTFPPISQPFLQPSQSTQMGLPSIKVRVEGKLLLIPLQMLENTQESKTIAWLAEEASRRYYSFEGQEPRLSLQTEEGAMLSPQDTVTLLLGCREVIGVVTSWKVRKATERYREVCTEMGVEVDEYLEQCLDGSSFSLSLADCGLDAAMVEPVFRSLATQTTLQHLVLCDNRLGDDGIQMLAKLIPKLPHLRELDLSCNGITGDGLNIFVQQVVEHQACQRLEVLKLSHNRLGKTCLGPLSRLLQVTKALMFLSVTSIGLTAASFTGSNRLSMERIERLEASMNLLGSEGVRALLSGLNMQRVVTLHLAHTGVGVVSEVASWLAEGNPCRLQALNLAHCQDQETAFTQLVHNLTKAPLLEHLELSYSDTMDEHSLQLLYQLPLKILRLPGVRVGPFAPSAPPPPVHQLSCLALSSTSPSPYWALRGPFKLLTNNPCTS